MNKILFYQIFDTFRCIQNETLLVETLTKNRLKFLRRYLHKKHRIADGQCLVGGGKLCLEALNNNFPIETLVYARGTGKQFRHIINHPNVYTSFTSPFDSLKSLSEVDAPQGVIGLVPFGKPQHDLGSEKRHKRYIVFDSIADPGNIGTLIRSASWFGWDGVVCGTGCVEITNGKVIRSSMGAIFHIPVWDQCPLQETLTSLRKVGFIILGATSHDNESKKTDIPDRFALVIGNESDGLSEDVTNLCDSLITVPGSGKAESLNAAVSGSILMYQFST